MLRMTLITQIIPTTPPSLPQELRQLSKEERKRQSAAIREVIGGAQVIASTLTGVLHHSLEGAVFDVCVIDEAAQALEAACWGALLKGRRCEGGRGTWFGCICFFVRV